MAYQPKMVKVRNETYLALRAFCAEVMESSSKGRIAIPDIQMDGVSIDYAIRLLLGEHEALKRRRKKADQKRTQEGRRRKGNAKGKPKGENLASEV